VHGSDSPDSAEREIKIFFPDLVSAGGRWSMKDKERLGLGRV